MKPVVCALFAPILALALTAFALPALTAETVAPPRDSDRNCTQPQERNPFAIWRSGDGVMRFSGSGTQSFEFYGHGIDLSPEASLTGITGSDGKRASARITDRRIGAVNAARGCGNIASVVVEIVLPKVTSANSGTLHVGSENFDVRAVPIVITQATWEEDNFSDGASMTAAQRQANDAAQLQAATNTCRQRLLAGITTCFIQGYFLGDTLNQACAAFRALGATCDTQLSRPASEHGSDYLATVGNCGDEFGVRTQLTSANPPTLTVTLPDRRDGPVFNCWTKPMFAAYDRQGTGKVTAKFPVTTVTTTLTQTSNGGPVLSFSDEADTFEGRLGRLGLTRDTWLGLVGVYTYDLNLNPTSDSAALRLVIQSQPGFGVRSVAAPAFVASVGRLNSTYKLTVTPVQATRSGQTFVYDIAGQPAGVSCLTVPSGTATPAANLTTFPIELTVNEVAACYNRAMTVTVSAQGATPGDTRFAKSAAITIPPPSTVVAPKSQPNVTTVKNLP